MKTWSTVLREAIVHVLKSDLPLFEIVGRRIFAGRAAAWNSEELPAVSVYLEKTAPVENDLSPPPDWRRFEVTVEVLASFEEGLEETLELVSEHVNRLLTLPALGRYFEASGFPDRLLAIDWLGDEQGLIDGGEEAFGALQSRFAIEIRLPGDVTSALWRAENPGPYQPPPDPVPGPPAPPQLPSAFKSAGSGWNFPDSGPDRKAEDYLELEGEENE